MENHTEHSILPSALKCSYEVRKHLGYYLYASTCFLKGTAKKLRKDSAAATTKTNQNENLQITGFREMFSYVLLSVTYNKAFL